MRSPWPIDIYIYMFKFMFQYSILGSIPTATAWLAPLLQRRSSFKFPCIPSAILSRMSVHMRYIIYLHIIIYHMYLGDVQIFETVALIFFNSTRSGRRSYEIIFVVCYHMRHRCKIYCTACNYIRNNLFLCVWKLKIWSRLQLWTHFIRIFKKLFDIWYNITLHAHER